MPLLTDKRNSGKSGGKREKKIKMGRHIFVLFGIFSFYGIFKSLLLLKSGGGDKL